MRSIKMTAEQTEAYDNGDGPTQDGLMRDLRARARYLANISLETVEIYTRDGVVADVAHPEGESAYREAVEALSRDAAEAGDMEQVDLCERALAHDPSAHRRCVDAILAAQA